MAAKKVTGGKTAKSQSGRAVTGKQPVAVRSGAYFLSLTVENIRSFGPEQILDLSDGHGRPAHWTVILGNNGVGKTTLLQCLTAFEPEESPWSSGERKRFWLPKGFLSGRRPSSDVSWRPVRQGVAMTTLKARFFAGSLTNGPGASGSSEETILDLAQRGVVGALGITEPYRNLVCYGYGATRRMGAGSLSTLKESGHNDSLFREDVPLRNAEEWLLQADYAASKESAARPAAIARRERVKELLINLLPEVSDIRFVAPDSENPTARVEVQTPYGWVEMGALSLGYKTLIAWMVDLASRLFERYPDSPDPLAEPAVVLVDEIDLHLHPQWQRILIRYLGERFPNTQFIVTAHSPLIVQSAPDANIVVLRREGDHVKIDNDVEAIRGWRVDQILTSDLFNLASARPPQFDALLAERTKLLSKARLTKKDQKRLEDLEAQIGHLPAGETKAEQEAIELIKDFATQLKAKK